MAEKPKRKQPAKCPSCGRNIVLKSEEGSEPPISKPYNYRKSTLHQCKLTAAERRAGLITRFWRSEHVYQEIWYAEGVQNVTD